MSRIQSRLWDLLCGNVEPRAIGRASVPPPDDTDQPTINLPNALLQVSSPAGYAGRRLDAKYLNRNVGPLRRGPGSQVLL